MYVAIVEHVHIIYCSRCIQDTAEHKIHSIYFNEKSPGRPRAGGPEGCVNYGGAGLDFLYGLPTLGSG